jgi:Phage tail protein (Tail_P2_I)
VNTPPDHAARLLEWLPAVWRERDRSGDLGKLLGVAGELLDAFHATIAQRAVDGFPDADPDGRHCQPWLLPYIAQLLDVRLVSPDEAGRRAELADAVAWRQRKGTRGTVEAIAEAVGRFEVEVQEGWKRVAITPRVDRPLLPESAFGEPAIPADAGPAARARHPALPAATLDLRWCSRAVQCDPDDPAAHETNFAGRALHWRQLHRHGVPCAPDSYQDVSRRTVDLRTPGPARGRYHPRRVLLALPPPEGHCSARAPSVHWNEVLAPDPVPGLPVRVATDQIHWNGQLVDRVTYTGLGEVPVKLRGAVTFSERVVHRFENLWLDNKVQINQGAAQLLNCAARHLMVTTDDQQALLVEARGCLFKQLQVARGRVALEYVTVLDRLVAERLDASDCILVPPLHKDLIDDDVPEAGCIRFSRLFHLPAPADPDDPELVTDPVWVAQGKRSALRCFNRSCTRVAALFWSDTFGKPGCGVLHPQAHERLQSGAEDGGEMGGCHELRHVLRRRAVQDKLHEFLPVGIEAVLVFDRTLACAPPRPE